MVVPLEQVLEGKYEILRKIGEGGMGSVYLVRHRLLEEDRVVKVLRAQNAERDDHRQRFLHEARTAIRLKHNGLAQFHDFAVGDDGTAYIVMEYVEGIPLDVVLDAGKTLSPSLAMEIGRQTAEALHYLHTMGYVHRDVAPDNLMLSRGFDGEPAVKLIDLGIAKHLETDAKLTVTGTFVGKVRYCSPEQFSQNEDSELDPRSDLYSMGLILYELLTGRYPYRGETFSELAGAHLFKEPISFASSDPEGHLGNSLRSLVLQTLEKKPEDRPESAGTLVEQIDAIRESLPDREPNELETILEEAAAQRKRALNPSSGGTTQGRLDASFSLDETTAHHNVTTAVPPPPGAESKGAKPKQIDPDVTLETTVGVPPPPPPAGGEDTVAHAAVAKPETTSAAEPKPAAAKPKAKPSSGDSVDVLALLKGPVGWGLGAAVVIAGVAAAVMLSGGETAPRNPVVVPTLAEVLDPVEVIDADASADEPVTSEPLGVTAAPPAPWGLELPEKLDLDGPQIVELEEAPAEEVAPVIEEPLAEEDTLLADGEADTGESELAAGDAEVVQEAEPVDEAAEVAAGPTTSLEVRKASGGIGRFRNLDRMPNALNWEQPSDLRAPQRSVIYAFEVQINADGTVTDAKPRGRHADQATALLLASALLRTTFEQPIRQGNPSRGRVQVIVTVSP